MLKKFLVILVLLLTATPLLANSNLAIGSPIPSFKLTDLSGKTVSLDLSLGSRATLLSFFASWSKSCKAEIDFLKDLHEKYGGKGIKIIGISFDRESTVLQKYISDQKIEFTIVHDKKLRTLKDYRILIIPTLFVIDRGGNIQNIYVDFDKNVEEALTQEIEKLLVP